MDSPSSGRSVKKLVSVVILIEQPMSLSSPIFNLLKSNYPLSKIEVFFVGTAFNIQKSDAYKQFRRWVKTVKTVSIKSSESIYSEVFPMTRGEICLFTNSNCSPEVSWIKRTVQTFSKNNLTGIVLGATQQRQVNVHNKVERYCEQVGWNSTGQVAEGENGNLNLNKIELFVDENTYRIMPLLKPINLAVSSFLLSKSSKNLSMPDILEKLKSEKLKFFYNPETEIKWFHSIDFKTMDREIGNMSREKNLWLSQHSKRINVQLQFFGKWEWSMPFWTSVNVWWGDFHWLNLFGIWILVECLTKGFVERFGEGFWFRDEVLLLLSGFGFFLFKYFLPVLKIQPWSDFILWCWIRYRTNMSMFLNGLWTGLKIKCFYWGESW